MRAYQAHPSPSTTAAVRVPLRLWMLILAGCVIAAFLDAGQIAVQGLLDDPPRVEWRSVTFQAGEWLFLAVLTFMTFTLGRRFPVRSPDIPRALGIHASGALGLCVAWAALGVGFRRSLGIGWDVPVRSELVGWTLFSLPWSFFMYFAVLGTVHAFTYYVEAKDRELEASQLASRMSEAHLRSLRSQLQPHFLFNTLNAVTVLVRDGKGSMAVGMLERLSDLLRHLLQSDQPHEIPLSSELGLIEGYLEIERVRFSDRLRAEFAIDADVLGAAVPSFLLQPLVENALRHGLAGMEDEVWIEIGARRSGDALELWIHDEGPGPSEAMRSGVGLANTRERLRTMYGSEASMTLQERSGGGAALRIVLPFRLIDSRGGGQP